MKVLVKKLTHIIKNVALNLQDMTTVDTRKLANTTANGTAGYTTPAKGNAGVYLRLSTKHD